MMTTAYTLQVCISLLKHCHCINTAQSETMYLSRDTVFYIQRSGSALGGLLYFTLLKLKIFHNFLLLNYLY